MSMFWSRLSVLLLLIALAGFTTAVQAADAPDPDRPNAVAKSEIPSAAKSLNLPPLTEASSEPVSVCPAKPLDTNIHMKLNMPEPKIDHSLSRYDLQDFDVSTKSPYGSNHFTHVNGLMRGPIELKTNITVAWQTEPKKRDNCFWYRAINLTLGLEPVIYVASEIQKDNCYYNAIIEHEMKHVEVDRGLVRDYQNIVYDTIENFVQEHGTLDHIASGQEKNAQKQLAKALEDQIRDIHKRMRVDRMKRQAEIDSLKEYSRVADQCGPVDSRGDKLWPQR